MRQKKPTKHKQINQQSNSNFDYSVNKVIHGKKSLARDCNTLADRKDNKIDNIAIFY